MSFNGVNLKVNFVFLIFQYEATFFFSPTILQFGLSFLPMMLSVPLYYMYIQRVRTFIDTQIFLFWISRNTNLSPWTNNRKKQCAPSFIYSSQFCFVLGFWFWLWQVNLAIILRIGQIGTQFIYSQFSIIPPVYGQITQ